MISTDDLVVMVQKGDIDAFDELFEKYKNEAVRTAYLITGNWSICEDIAQETFITCYKSIGSLKSPKAFTAWFYHILTRIAWKYGKIASLEITDEDILSKADEVNVDISFEKYEQSEINRVLYSEIAHLEPKQKASIILYYFCGLTTKEIAQVLKCREGTVKSRLHTARQNLKSNLDAKEHNEKERGVRAGNKVI